MPERLRGGPGAAGAPGPGAGALLATGCGTAIASICTFSLFQIERLLGGLWSVAAVLAAGLCCMALARALGRLAGVIPSAAGLLAYLSRGLGRRTGMMLAVPYLLLTLFLIGAEAVVVGVLLARTTRVPAAAGALAFLLSTWALCRAGVRIGYRAQSVATWALIGGLAALSLVSLAGAGARGDLSVRLLPPAPAPAHFVAAVGQALFLFMGFELITSQAEVAAPGLIGPALRRSVFVLGAFYGLVSLGFSCLLQGPAHRSILGGGLSGGLDAAQVVPQVALAEQAGGQGAVALIVGLSLLSSFTSFNGALLTLSRFAYALAAQGVLPRGLMRMDGRTLVPRRALLCLLLLATLATALVGTTGALMPSILGAAVAAALVYAGVAWVRALPFAEAGRSRRRRLLGSAIALTFVALGVGVVADAGAARPFLLGLLVAAYGAALLAVVHVRRVGQARQPGRPATPSLVGGASHAD